MMHDQPVPDTALCRPLRIAMLSLHSSPIGALGSRDTGGMSVYVRELSRALGARGDRVDIYTQGTSTATHTVTLYENVRLVYLSIGARDEIPKQALYPHINLFYEQLEAFRRSERLRYDLIHSHYWLSGWLGLRAQKTWHVPHAMTFHTLGAVKNMVGVQPPESPQRIAAEQILCRHCTAIIVGSRREARYLEQLYKTAPQQIFIIPCGVNRDRFYRKDRQGARKRLGFTASERIVLYVGRLDPLKGACQLIEVLGHLKNVNNVRLVIVGGGAENEGEKAALEQQAQCLQVHDRVRFAGRVDQTELPLYYSAADVVAVPSQYESFGLVMLEALSCGTPVVAMPVGAAEEIIQNPVAGAIIQDGSLRTFAHAIARFLENGKAAPENEIMRRASVARYDWRLIAARIRAVYQRLIALGRYGWMISDQLPAYPVACEPPALVCDRLL
ncbi:MAG: glycosyltransferase [Desulfobacterota bacterium]|nr:glycosyltransferase [Thermodesulfobacteriota bacterium]